MPLWADPLARHMPCCPSRAVSLDAAAYAKSACSRGSLSSVAVSCPLQMILVAFSRTPIGIADARQERGIKEPGSNQRPPEALNRLWKAGDMLSEGESR